MNIPNKKPFGLTLASKIAEQALHESIAPASIILGNLLLLQKDSVFPKDLDTHFFSFQKKMASDIDKKNITLLLNELKKPNLNIQQMLEDFIKTQWVIKKAPLKIEPPRNVASKHIKKNKPINLSNQKKIVAPIITIKKNKI